MPVAEVTMHPNHPLHTREATVPTPSSFPPLRCNAHMGRVETGKHGRKSIRLVALSEKARGLQALSIDSWRPHYVYP